MKALLKKTSLKTLSRDLGSIPADQTNNIAGGILETHQTHTTSRGAVKVETNQNQSAINQGCSIKDNSIVGPRTLTTDHCF